MGGYRRTGEERARLLAAYVGSGDWRAVAGAFQVEVCCHMLCGHKLKRCLLIASPYRLT